MILQFFRMGAIDFLKRPVQTEDVKRLIQKVLDLDERRDTNGKHKSCYTIAVFSPKGGVGLIVVAVSHVLSGGAVAPGLGGPYRRSHFLMANCCPVS